VTGRRPATAPTERAFCGCGRTFHRPRGGSALECLACTIRTRLQAAGIQPDDPGLIHIAAVNAASRRKAGIPTPEGHAA
jgi:hypothetical protein